MSPAARRSGKSNASSARRKAPARRKGKGTTRGKAATLKASSAQATRPAADEIFMAAKPRLGVILPLPVRSRGGKLDEASRQMIEAEQALFVALRLAKLQPAARPNQAATQPPPRTSSSRKKTAA